MSSRRILVAAFGDAGHAFPAIALASELAERGHQVVIESWERWREPIESSGIEFRAAEEYVVFPPPPPGKGPGPADAARALEPLFDELDPELVVSDILTLAPTLAAEVAGVPRVTLIPHLYPEHQPGIPFFGMGLMPPRTPVGRRLWRAAQPMLESGLRRGRAELNSARAKLGLPPLTRFHGGTSEELVLVGTYPELELPRRWPAHVKVCGPLEFEIPHPDVQIPEGAGPLLLVAPSTAHDPHCELVRRCFSAFEGEPVRVLATTNGHHPPQPIEVPANGVLVDWLSYSQAMAAADLVVGHGGHGTVCRAISHGKPQLISPAIGDMAENGIRVQWSGCGLMLPAQLRSAPLLRAAARELIDGPRYRERAAEIGGLGDPDRRRGQVVAADAVEGILG